MAFPVNRLGAHARAFSSADQARGRRHHSPDPERVKGGIGQALIRALRQNLQRPWCRKTLTRSRLPPTVHDHSRYRLWQRRFYPFNVFSEDKIQEKLTYMHNNPVKRGLVSSPGDWPWSSWRFYYLRDASILRMDRLR